MAGSFATIFFLGTSIGAQSLTAYIINKFNFYRVYCSLRGSLENEIENVDYFRKSVIKGMSTILRIGISQACE